MGIECDGATYHSAKSVRDRDRLRQSVLEQLGWNIQRIWSTDWFKNPEAQLTPIIQQLNELKTTIQETEEASEVDVIDASLKEHAQHEQEIADLVSNEQTIKDRLLKFNQEVITKSLPNVEGSKRLLRSSMLEALIEFEPTTLSEFQEFIPSYLRHGTDQAEAQFLNDILEIIQDGQLAMPEID